MISDQINQPLLVVISVIFISYILNNYDNKNQVDIIFIDYKKAW